MYPQARPLGKPNPFSYIAALYGNNRKSASKYGNNPKFSNGTTVSV
jgi:phosphoglycolate phosphatase-like HAD superfamily hydrolase